MHFGLSEEQRELVQAVRQAIAKRSQTVDLRAALASDQGHDPELWRTLAEQIGAAALAIPEKFGGVGATLVETHLVLEELGRGLSPTPLLGSGVVATNALLLTGDDEACLRLLPDLASGATVAALAWADGAGRWPDDGGDITADTADTTCVLTGRSTLVLDGRRADVLLALARTADGIGLFEVAPEQAHVVPTPALDQTIDLATVVFDRTPASRIGGDLLGQVPFLRGIAATATTALQVGGAQEALDRTVAYLKERQQFGRPLASFQALKHRCADLVVAVETARSMSWGAAWAVAHGADDGLGSDEILRRAATAKSWCTDAFDLVASEMVQLHGGIAITWEHDAHLYFKRAHSTAQLFGRAHEARRQLLELDRERLPDAG